MSIRIAIVQAEPDGCRISKLNISIVVVHQAEPDGLSG